MIIYYTILRHPHKVSRTQTKSPLNNDIVSNINKYIFYSYTDKDAKKNSTAFKCPFSVHNVSLINTDSIVVRIVA